VWLFPPKTPRIYRRLSSNIYEHKVLRLPSEWNSVPRTIRSAGISDPLSLRFLQVKQDGVKFVCYIQDLEKKITKRKFSIESEIIILN
jgi:hypothetical protein